MSASHDKIRSLSFQAQPYRSDNGFEMPGLLGLFASIAIAGAILGWVANFVSQWFYLIILFPIGIGFGLGIVGSQLIQRNNIRNPVITGFAGLLGGVLAILVMHYSAYMSFKGEIDKALTPDLAEIAKFEPAQREEVLSTIKDPTEKEDATIFFASVDMAKSFPAYVDGMAKLGVSLSKAGSSSKGVNLGYTGSYIYWLIELLIVAGIAFFATKDAARQPFCAPCRKWKIAKALGFLKGDKTQLKSALSSGRGTDWLSMSPSDTVESGSFIVTRYSCPTCQTTNGSDFQAQLVKINKKGETSLKEVGFVTYKGSSTEVLDEMFIVEHKPETVEA